MCDTVPTPVCGAEVHYSKLGQAKNLSLFLPLFPFPPLSFSFRLHKQAVTTSFLEAVSYLDRCLFARALQVGI